MAYVNFKNSPSEETPLTGGATGNLNVMQENGTSHGTDTKLGYAQSFLNEHIINVSNEVDEDYRVNFIREIVDIDKSAITDNKFIDNNGDLQNSSVSCVTDFTNVNSNTNYTLYIGNTTSYTVRILFYNSSKTKISYVEYNMIGSTNFITPANCVYIRFQLPMANKNTVKITGTPSIVVDNEEIYSKEDTDIVDITGELTFATGWSIDSGKIYKQGKHIFGTIQIKTPSSLPASTNSQNVVRIPYTLANSYIMGGFTTNGDKWAITNGFAYVYISSNGYATIVNSSIATFFRLQIDVMEA